MMMNEKDWCGCVDLLFVIGTQSMSQMVLMLFTPAHLLFTSVQQLAQDLATTFVSRWEGWACA